MYSDRFSHLINEHPESADSLHRLEEYFQAIESRKENLSRIQLPADRVAEVAHISNVSELSHFLLLLIQQGLMERVVLIESPTGGVIKELTSADPIPLSIHDINQDVMIEVTLDHISSVYRPVLQ